MISVFFVFGCETKKDLLPRDTLLSQRVSMLGSDTQQRSSVKSIQIVFNEEVIIPNDALWITKNGQAINLSNATFTYENRTATWTFIESLPDGLYVATVKADKITDIAGNHLDGDKDGIAGGDFLLSFFRLYGDTTGDGTVNREDLIIMINKWLEPPEQTGLDFNRDGIINCIDIAVFAKNWNKSI